MREIYATWLYKNHIVDYLLLGDFLKYDKVIQNCTSATFVATAMSEVLEIVQSHPNKIGDNLEVCVACF